MSEPIRYRCDVTPALLDRAEQQLAALLWWGSERRYESRASVRQRWLPIVRWAGIALALAGIVVADAAIVMTPDTPCAGGTPWRYYATLPFFVLAGTLFLFLPRITPALRRWAHRVNGRIARRLLRQARQRAPYAAEYAVSTERIEATVAWQTRPVSTELRGVRSAIVCADLVGLFKRSGGRGLRRVVYFPDAAARETVRETLRAAGAEIVELP